MKNKKILIFYFKFLFQAESKLLPNLNVYKRHFQKLINLIFFNLLLKSSLLMSYEDKLFNIQKRKYVSIEKIYKLKLSNFLILCNNLVFQCYDVF